MSRAAPPELTRWLDSATRDLPADIAAMTRAELTAHYEDALDDYLAQGLAPDEAHARVLADLGGAGVVSDGLSDVHRGMTHYKLAAFASFGTLLTMIMLPYLHEALGLTEGSTSSRLLMAAGDIVFFTLITYVLLGLKRLLRWRYHVPGLDRLFAVAIGATAASEVVDAGSLLAFGWSFNTTMDSAPAFADHPPFLEFLALALPILLYFLIGASLIGIAARIITADVSLYGLGKPLAVITIVLGADLATAPALYHLDQTLILHITYVLVMLGHILIWPLLTLLFFRAVFRSPVRPTQMA